MNGTASDVPGQQNHRAMFDSSGRSSGLPSGAASPSHGPLTGMLAIPNGQSAIVSPVPVALLPGSGRSTQWKKR